MARAPRKPVKTTEGIGAVTAPSPKATTTATPNETPSVPTPIQRIDH